MPGKSLRHNKKTLQSCFKFYNNKIGQQKSRSFRFRHEEDSSPKFSPKFFSLKKNPENPKITHTVTSNGAHPLHPHLIQTRRHSGRLQLPLQRNHHTPNLHTVAAGLRTVVIPLAALQATDLHPSGRSTVKFDSLCSGLTSVQNPLKPKKLTV